MGFGHSLTHPIRCKRLAHWYTRMHYIFWERDTERDGILHQNWFKYNLSVNDKINRKINYYINLKIYYSFELDFIFLFLEPEVFFHKLKFQKLFWVCILVHNLRNYLFRCSTVLKIKFSLLDKIEIFNRKFYWSINYIAKLNISNDVFTT